MKYKITWGGPKEKVCRCNGELTTNAWMIKTFGSIDEVWMDKPGIAHVGNKIYCDDPNLFRKYAEKQFQYKITRAFDDISLLFTSSTFGRGIEEIKEKLSITFDEIRPYSELAKIDVKGLKEFFKQVSKTPL